MNCPRTAQSRPPEDFTPWAPAKAKVLREAEATRDRVLASLNTAPTRAEAVAQAKELTDLTAGPLRLGR